MDVAMRTARDPAVLRRATLEAYGARRYENVRCVRAPQECVMTPLDAYGIYGDWPKRTVTYSVLIPGVGIGGYEVGFRKHLPKGTIVSLVGVWKSWILFKRVPFCVVTLRASDLHLDPPVRIDLRQQSDGGLGLDPSAFARLLRN